MNHLTARAIDIARRARRIDQRDAASEIAAERFSNAVRDRIDNRIRNTNQSHTMIREPDALGRQHREIEKILAYIDAEDRRVFPNSKLAPRTRDQCGGFLSNCGSLSVISNHGALYPTKQCASGRTPGSSSSEPAGINTRSGRTCGTQHPHTEQKVR